MNKYLIVSGGSRGIGFEITKMLLENCYSVIYTYSSNNDAYYELENIAKTKNVQCIYYQLNISSADEVREFYDWFCNMDSEIIGLINNAGIANDNIMLNITDDQWDDVIKVNLYGTFFMCREFAKILILQKSGFIINIASVTGIKGSKGASNYAASKGGVIAFTKSIGLELARFGIRVNVIAPGYIKTNMLSGLDDNATEAIKEKLMLKRLGDPEEIARLVLYLTKEKHFFQNTVLEMDGGMI